MFDGLGLLIILCITGLAFYVLLYLVNLLDAQIQKRRHDSVDPDWWWQERHE